MQLRILLLLLALLTIVAAIAAPLPAQGLDPTKSLSQYRLDNWTESDGLPDRSVRDIVQDDEGFLWLATTRGLVRFDGVRFSLFSRENSPSLPSESIRALAVGPQGRLWIATSRGLCWKDAAGIECLASPEPALANVNSMAVSPSGDLWLGTERSGLLRFSQGEVRQRFSTGEGVGSQVTEVTAVGDKIWAASNRCLCLWSEAGIETVVGGPTYFALRDGQGRFWYGSPFGLTLQPATGERPQIFTRRQGLPGSFVRLMREDGQGNLWMGSNDGGLIRWRDGVFETLSHEQGLPSDAISSLLVDSEGSLWIGTSRGGLSRLKEGLFSVYSQSEGLPNRHVQSVYQDSNGTVWAGTVAGAARLQGQRFELLEGTEDLFVIAFEEDSRGTLWLGGVRTLMTVQEDRAQLFNSNLGLVIPVVFDMEQSNGDDFWFGNGSMLGRIREGEFRAFGRLAFGPSEEGMIRSLLWDSRNTLWIGRIGLHRWDEEKRELVAVEEAAELANREVDYLYEDSRHRFWIIAGGGLFNFGNEGLRQLGLDGVRAYLMGMVEDSRGDLWLNSSNGILRLARGDVDAALDGTLSSVPAERFGLRHGLLSSSGSEGNPNAWRASDGRLWFATRRGVASIDPEKGRSQRPPLHVYLESARADDRLLGIEAGAEVPPGANRLEIQYGAIDLLAGHDLRFRYRLEGFDRQWIEAGSQRSVTYTGLRPGRYDFQVQAARPEEEWRSPASPLALRVVPKLYQTNWFMALSLIAASALVWGGYGLRVRQLKLRESHLQGLVSARTESLRLEKAKTEELYSQLQQDHSRKVRELEEARSLQLSMLPADPPRLDDLEIAVHMSTATEVGGDYYDFHLDGDGTLTVAIGDATGHGMKAGLVVATAKTYFQSLAEEPDSRLVARRISKGLKEMRMRSMYMSLSLLKYKDGWATLLAAGMPPALLWRSGDGSVERLLLKGMPLGSFVDFPYQTREIQLRPNDMLLMLSDGLVELFNGSSQTLDEEPVIESLKASAPQGAQSVVGGLVELGRSWRGDTPQNDDITLVAIRYKG